MNFTVDRATWLHGEGSMRSFLMRQSDGKKCCLGFRALACDYSEEQITEVAAPLGLYRNNISPIGSTTTGLDKWVGFFDFGSIDHSTKALDIMELNDSDDEDAGDEERESELIRLFALLGDTLTFTGEYPNV